jgi:opacity protein-like surface antigen
MFLNDFYIYIYAATFELFQVFLSLFVATSMASIIPAPYVAQVAPAVVGKSYIHRTQHHSQNAYGQYDYGYAEPNSQKQETRHPDGTVTGSYS